MHAGKNFKLWEAILWTRHDIYRLALIGAVPTLIYEVVDWKFIAVPWLPVAMVGTAVAFLIAFKNSASYDRLWEARKIWGGIVNQSRLWGIMSKDYVSNLHATKPASESVLVEERRVLIYRHMAWLTALRFQLRQPRVWESMENRNNREYRKLFRVPELESDMGVEIASLLSQHELLEATKSKNAATQIVRLQADHLLDLRVRGLIDDFRHMEMQRVLGAFYDEQGKSERIKNFPYPRQFATLNRYFVWLFVLLIPFGMLEEFNKLGELFAWLTIPFSVLVSWVFLTMERIGESSENPFQGGANDVPITAISRTIEIDLREMLGEQELPPPISPHNHILM